MQLNLDWVGIPTLTSDNFLVFCFALLKKRDFYRYYNRTLAIYLALYSYQRDNWFAKSNLMLLFQGTIFRWNVKWGSSDNYSS